MSFVVLIRLDAQAVEHVTLEGLQDGEARCLRLAGQIIDARTPGEDHR